MNYVVDITNWKIVERELTMDDALRMQRFMSPARDYVAMVEMIESWFTDGNSPPQREEIGRLTFSQVNTLSLKIGAQIARGNTLLEMRTSLTRQ